jgi:hypothetical protein
VSVRYLTRATNQLSQTGNCQSLTHRAPARSTLNVGPIVLMVTRVVVRVDDSIDPGNW